MDGNLVFQIFHGAMDFATEFDSTEDELFWNCHNAISSILSRRMNMDCVYYIGVTECPHVRFYDEDIGHCKNYEHMYLLGVACTGQVVCNVETRLIAERRGIDSRCKNRGLGGERVAKSFKLFRFFYLCTASMEFLLL